MSKLKMREKFEIVTSRYCTYVQKEKAEINLDSQDTRYCTAIENISISERKERDHICAQLNK